MKTSRTVAIAAAALVAGLTLGSIGLASAAPVEDAPAGTPVGYGLRIGHALRDAGGRLVDVLADLTGLSADDIHDRRVAGESVADIAEAEGVEPDAVVDGALEVREEFLDEKVADGTIDEATKAEILERMTDRLTERLDSTQTGPFGGRGGGMGGRGMGMGGRGMGMGGAGCTGACDVSSDEAVTQ